MLTIKALKTCAIVALIGSSLGACAAGRLDPYQGVPYGYYTTGSKPLTKQTIDYQDTVVQPRCETWAKETTPKAWKMAGAYATNHFVAGAAGAAIGYTAQANIVGAIVHPTSVAGVAVTAGVQSGFNAGMSGLENHDAQVHTGTRGCIISDAGGYHYVPPSEGQRIKEGKQAPTSYGPAQRVIRDVDPSQQ